MTIDPSIENDLHFNNLSKDPSYNFLNALHNSLDDESFSSFFSNKEIMVIYVADITFCSRRVGTVEVGNVIRGVIAIVGKE